MYITSDSSVPGTEQPCLTLSQFAANSSDYVNFITTVVLSPGKHYLSGVNLSVSNLDNFVMKSAILIAQIECTNNSHIYVNQSQYIHITNLEFIGCGANQVKFVQEFMISNTKFNGQEVAGSALELIETTAQIIDSTFVSNNKGTSRKCAQYEIPLEDKFKCN